MKYNDLIGKMTLEEKASLMSGANFWNTKPISRLGIPGMMLTDGPHGLRKQGGKADHLGLNKSIPSTCFPTAATLANSWDTRLLEEVGECLGTEAAAAEVSVLLGPGLNIKRNPLCGRNFEYFSEDPYLTGKLAAAMIRGIQSNGVSACPKHFAVNSQENRRMVMNEVVDERAFREIYLEGFRYAVEEGQAKTIMTSYNKINGSYANENMHLLQDILYGEWKYQGVTVTDWGGENDRVMGLKAGNQLEMPSSAGMTDQDIVEAVRNGSIKEELLDQRVDELLTLILETKEAFKKKKQVSYDLHHQKAKKAAAQSYVLLKNDKETLPLSQHEKIAIIGDFGKTPRYQGAGSSLVNPIRLDNALEEFKKEPLQIIGYEKGFHRFGQKSAKLRNAAVELAKKADTVILFLGLDESSETEGLDRTTMKLPTNQLELLHAISKVDSKVVVVISGGAPIETGWSKHTDAILLSYLGGQASGEAMVELLMGKVSPSGKLAETYPLKYEQVPFAKEYPGKQLTSVHRESIYVGYRYYDTVKARVAWPFGFGLSYTTFDYRNMEIMDEGISLFVKNTGKVAGAEVVQLYISKHNSEVFRPEKELKGFAKLYLQPEEERKVFLKWDQHSFQYFNTLSQKWVEERGEYQLLLGASSRDIRLRGSIIREGENAPNPYLDAEIPHYRKGHLEEATEKEFEILLGSNLPSGNWDTQKPLGYNDTIGQGQYKKGFGRVLYQTILLARKLCFFFGKPIAGNYLMFVFDLPFRHVARMTAGKVDMAMLDGLLCMVNGNFRKGLKALLQAKKEKDKNRKRNHMS